MFLFLKYIFYIKSKVSSFFNPLINSLFFLVIPKMQVGNVKEENMDFTDGV